jgi:hypothetical protein
MAFGLTRSFGLACKAVFDFGSPDKRQSSLEYRDEVSGPHAGSPFQSRLNRVSSYKKSAARAVGLDEPAPHGERYAVADEYLDVVYK